MKRIFAVILSLFLGLAVVGGVQAQDASATPEPTPVDEMEYEVDGVPDPESTFFGLQVSWMNFKETIEKLVTFNEEKLVTIETKYAERNQRLLDRIEDLEDTNPELVERLEGRLDKISDRQEKRVERIGGRLEKLGERGEQFEERKNQWVEQMRERRENLELRQEQTASRSGERRSRSDEAQEASRSGGLGVRDRQNTEVAPAAVNQVAPRDGVRLRDVSTDVEDAETPTSNN